ncbi:hypothetical protein ACH5RR_008548 [Cinchona calisaya]|uniref:Uncharacterized protein n=1 Tax=Cinchona calisaya TaxID=153742 RepID=A0ABD3AE63_9GENT
MSSALDTLCGQSDGAKQYRFTRYTHAESFDRSITCATIWMIAFGLSGAVRSTRVSNELGAGHPQTACLAVYVVLLMAITEGVVLG